MMPQPRIHRFDSPLSNRVGRIHLPWTGHGDALPLTLVAHVPPGGRAQVWTNANHNHDPSLFYAVDMEVTHHNGDLTTFGVSIPITRVGNYRAVGRVSADGGDTWVWMSHSGMADLLFRPRDPAVDTLNMEEVSVPNVNVGKPCGTLADLIGNGSPLAGGPFTLEWLAAQGKNAIWLLPPCETSRVVQLHPADDAGSPYAVKDFFAVRSEISRNAKGLEAPAAQRAALQEFCALVAHAHSLGMRVIVDLPLNHLGHGHVFADLFVVNGVRQVRRLDFSQVDLTAQQRAHVEASLAAGTTALEKLMPWWFGSLEGHAEGARNTADLAPGGWFEWPDALQLNHGRRRTAFRQWEDQPVLPQHRSLAAWLGRVLRFWAVDMGVDGFRVDHLAGLPLHLMETVTNAVQADVDACMPGKTILFVGEDFDTAHRTHNCVDVLQGGWFEQLCAVDSPSALQAILDDDWLNHLLSLGTHDEQRPALRLAQQPAARTRLMCLLPLLGGPVSDVVGDVLDETHPLPFKQFRHLQCLAQTTDHGRSLAARVGAVGRLRARWPALQRATRAWPQPVLPGNLTSVAVLSRCPLPSEAAALWVCCNFDDHAPQPVAHLPDPATAAWLQPNAAYQLWDLLGSAEPLWPTPRTGGEVQTDGVRITVPPSGLMVLALKKAPSPQRG